MGSMSTSLRLPFWSTHAIFATGIELEQSTIAHGWQKMPPSDGNCRHSDGITPIRPPHPGYLVYTVENIRPIVDSVLGFA
jgi:hypothetical protein